MDTQAITRFEVIDHTSKNNKIGRVITSYNISVEVSIQDEGRTMKVFLTDRVEEKITSEELKPIHKFNGGRGATLCNECNVIISEGLTDDLYCEEHGGKPKFKYKLVRTRDNLTKYGNSIKWIGWNEDGTYKEQYDEPTIGSSLVFDFTFGYYEWMTTSIVSFKEQKKCITFTTQNSEYKLYYL